MFLVLAYLTTTKNVFLRNKLEAQPAQNRLFGITQGETFGEISKLQTNCFISCQGPNGLLSMFVGQYE